MPGGSLPAEDSTIEERVSLHADDSGRILHMKNEELRWVICDLNHFSQAFLNYYYNFRQV